MLILKNKILQVKLQNMWQDLREKEPFGAKIQF